MAATRWVLGGYGEFLGVVEIDDDDVSPPVAVAVAVAARPSWVLASPDGRFVYAALESAEGRVGAWRVTGEPEWPALGTVATDGADPCHLALSPDGRWLMAANYTSGSVSVHPVRDDGSLGARTDLVQHQGSTGPVADRQDGPHAHQVVLALDGHVLVCDLGLDVVIAYALDAQEGRLTERHRSSFPSGTGPRHLVLTADGRTAYVVGELASTVSVCRVDGPRLEVLETVSARAADAVGESTVAEVVLSADESTLFVSNRGDDTVATLAVDAASARLVGVMPSGGATPRWIGLVDERWILTTNQDSDGVALLRLAGAAGEATGPVATTTWPQPTCAALLHSLPSAAHA